MDAITRTVEGEITMSDLISRQAAIDAIISLTNCTSVRDLYEYVQEHNLTDMWSGGVNDAIDAVIAVPSAQHYDEWCTDCKEYDHERHCCPRWNRVIREALNDAQPERKTGQWLGVSADRYTTVASYVYVCSECGETNVGKTRYCPHCGASMKGEE